MGQAPPGSACNSDRRGTPFVKAGEFGERRPLIREWTTKPLKLAKSTDVLVCVVGATCGKLNLGADCAIGRSVAAIRPNPSLLNQGFLYAFLRGWTLRLRSGSQGSAQGVVTREMLASIPMPLPPLAEQERIMKLLDEADELRELRIQADRRTADLIPSLFHDMFGNPVVNSNTWLVRRLEDVVASGRIVTYGIVQAGPNIPSGIPYIRTGDLKEGIIKVPGLLRTTREIAASYSRSEVIAGDIVMSIRATVGATAVVTEELSGANLTQGTARISPGSETVTDYLLWFLRMPGAQSWIQGQVKGATFREITLRNLRQLPVVLPPLPLQKEFAARVSEIRAVQAEQSASRRRLDDLFQSMLYRAFQGEL